MDITIITTKEDFSLDTTKYFGILLSKSLSIIHMVHWYIKNHNVHEILGELYEDLDGLFDKLQEEIIGTSQEQGKLFPSFSTESLTLDNVDQYPENNRDLIDTYYKTVVKITAILSSLEFINYIESVDSGINNTKEDILSRINKANYLLSMVSL